jgi:transcriptional regulator with XRE-family HTH domain
MPKTVSSRQLKAALAMVGWKVADLAEASGVSESTIGRLENADGPLGGKPGVAEKLIEALERAGVVFVGEANGGPAVYLPKGNRRR